MSTLRGRVLRPADATHDGLRKCLHWLDACREIGWAESVMSDLESLFWKYHDSAGNKKPQNNELCRAADSECGQLKEQSK